MTDEQLEKDIGDLLVFAQPVADLPPTLRGRVMSALAQSPRKRRLRLATAIAVAGVVLFGLGFVPFPAGSAKGTLAKTMEAFASDQLIIMHTVRHSWDEQGNEYSLTESWFASDGFLRQDEFKGDKLIYVRIWDGTKTLSYYVAADGQLQAFENFLPLGVYNRQHGVKLPLWERSADMVDDILNHLKSVDHYKNVALKEYQERSLWGGAINIAEVETDRGGAGPGRKWRFEINPATDRVMKTVSYVASGTAEIWQKKSETSYEWGVPIPKSAHDFALPAGTKLTRSLWWQDKADKVVAQASTPDWEVTLRDVQVDNEGNILASFSGRNLAAFNQIVVEDNVGNRYGRDKPMGQSSEPGYSYAVFSFIKVAGDSKRIPATATFTFQPAQKETSEDQEAVLKDVPLPARQPLSMKDLKQKDDKVIQY